MGQIDESKRYDEKEVEIETEFLEGSRQLVLGQYEKAIEIYSELIKKDKENAVIHFQLSRCYEATKDSEKAIFHGKEAVKIDPSNEYYTMQLAESYEIALQYDDAASAYLAYSKQKPKVPFFYERAVYFYLQNNDEVKAISALNLMEKNIGIQENISKQLHEIYATKGDTKNAVKQLEKLTKKYPNITRYQLNLANYYVKLGEPKKANKIFSKLKDSDNSIAIQEYMETSTSSDKRLTELRAIKTEISETSIPLDKKIVTLIPILQSLNDSYNEEVANELLDASARLVDLYPESPKSHALFADVNYSMGNTNEAIDSYKQTIKLNSSVFDVWFQLMTMQKDQNLIDDLYNTSDQALLRFPNQAIAYLFHAYSLNRKNKPEDALDILQEGVLMSGNNDKLRRSIKTEMAYAKYLQKEYEAALKILDSEPNNSFTALELKGDIYFKQNNESEALKMWKKALELNPKNEVLSTKIQNKQL